MPWQHCEQTIADDRGCPTCGTSKEQWTVEFNVTRPLRVQRRATLLLSLIDPRGAAVPGEPFRVEGPDGATLHEGELDELGRASVRAPDGGVAVVVLPRRLPGDVFRKRAADEAPTPASAQGGGGASAPPAEAPREARVTCRVGRRQVLQLRPRGALALRLEDELGRGPLASLDYVVTHAAGLRFEGTTDAQGDLRHDDVPLDYYWLSIDEAAVPAPAVRRGDSPLVLRVHGIPPAPTSPGAGPAATRGLKVRVRDAAGQALADVEYVLVLPDGERRGRTDEDGVLHERDLPAGDIKARLGDGRVLVFRRPRPAPATDDEPADEGADDPFAGVVHHGDRDVPAEEVL